MKSLYQIRTQLDRIMQLWKNASEPERRHTWRNIYRIYMRYLYNIAEANGITLQKRANYAPGVAAIIAFPQDYWKRSPYSINHSKEFHTELHRPYPREVYAKQIPEELYL